MLKKLRVIFDVAATLQDVQTRLTDLEETTKRLRRDLDGTDGDVDRVLLQVKRLRGTVTGSIRKESQDSEPEDDAEAINLAILEGRMTA